jgi:hypothetical protein
MSLLGSQVYANPDKPLWVSTDGGVISGNLTVENLNVTGNAGIVGDVTSSGEYISLGGDGLILKDATGSTTWGRVTATATDLFLQTPSNVKFTQPFQSSANTFLALSAPGSGLDSFTTNFLNAIGPVPANPIPVGANPIIDLVTGSGNRTDTFAITTAYTLVSNAVYDVQATGVVTWTAGSAPTAGDRVSVTVEVGSDAVSGQSVIYYPGDAPEPWVINVGNNFSLRARVPARGSIPPNPVVQVSYVGAAGTGTISGVCTYMSITRVA